MYCSKDCQTQSLKVRQTLSCKLCEETFERVLSEVKKHQNHFCSRSCAATYNNANKKHWTRRSKLEAWLEENTEMREVRSKSDISKEGSAFPPPGGKKKRGFLSAHASALADPPLANSPPPGEREFLHLHEERHKPYSFRYQMSCSRGKHRYSGGHPIDKPPSTLMSCPVT